MRGDWGRPQSFCCVQDRIYLLDRIYCCVQDREQSVGAYEPIASGGELRYVQGQRILVLTPAGYTLQVYRIPMAAYAALSMIASSDERLFVTTDLEMPRGPIVLQGL